MDVSIEHVSLYIHVMYTYFWCMYVCIYMYVCMYVYMLYFIRMYLCIVSMYAGPYPEGGLGGLKTPLGQKLHRV